MRARASVVLVVVLVLSFFFFFVDASYCTPAPDGTVHFATFGNAFEYRNSLARICQEAAAMNTFATIYSISEEGLGEEFWDRYGSFVKKYRRGFGYWIWKPWVCLHILRSLPEGHVLVYADAGCTLNAAARDRLQHYIRSARAHPDGIVGFRIVVDGAEAPEARWTKAETLAALGCVTPACHRSTQVMATVFLIRNSPATRRLVHRWLDLCTANDGALVTDASATERINEQFKEQFKEHRHDQSIWSLLVKQHAGTVLYDDEVDSTSPLYPIWGTRKRT